MIRVILSVSILLAFGACAQQNKKVNSASATKASYPLVAIDTTWTDAVVKTNEEWKKELTKDQYYILREQGTERPFTSEFYELHDEGTFICVACKNPLFPSKTKFDSGTGWPSFYQPYFKNSVQVGADNSHGMSRDEVACKRCGGHLGHVFNDGPLPTGLRYCIDGLALQFVPKEGMSQVGKANATATFAGGCFWCEEEIFEQIKGVSEVISGYAGGKEKDVNYDNIAYSKTGHAEAFQVHYDTTIVSFQDLVRVFFASIDPTQVNGQGPDRGKQYRTIAFYNNQKELDIIKTYFGKMQLEGDYDLPFATEFTPFDFFVKAEDYHQNYVALHPNNPYVQHESIPRRDRTLKKVQDLLKK